MSYAIITLGGKQYVVRAGEKLLVDRLSTESGKTFSPDVLFLGGDGQADLKPSGSAVTAKVVGHVLGEKIRIGKYRKRTGYRRHTGFRARLTEIEIESVGGRKAAKQAAPKKEPAAKARPAKAAIASEEAPRAEAPKAEPGEGALPAGYEKMTVAQIGEGAKSWDRPSLEAALAYEQAHAKRKGAFAALESAITRMETE
jgi:large subunit ribosomal protein L21